MNRALLRKELAQHGPAFALLAVLTSGAVVLAIARDAHEGLAGSVFWSLLMIYWFVLPVIALLLSQRLVALEFREKTQLFLEALPLPRWRMIAVKYALGLAVALALALGALALTALLGRAHELLTPRFLTILAVRATAWTWCIFGFFFATAFLGRYRLPFLLALIVGYFVCNHVTDFRPEHFGPFAVMDRRFPFENTHFPLEALGITTLLALGFLALGLGMGLAREGSVAALLGERMSQRERLFIGAIAFSGLIAFYVFDEAQTRAPYDVRGATAESREGVTVKMALPENAEPGRAAALGAHAADELAALAEYLGLAALPPVFIVLRADFGAGQFERVKIKETNDVVIRANFNAPQFDERVFLSWLVREVLLARSHGRLDRERKRWVLDGFQLFWKHRAEADHAPLIASARGEKVKGFAISDLARWLSFRQRAGEMEAGAVAWTGLQTLAQQHGEDARREFLRAVLGPEMPHDLRATWHDWRHPVARSLEAAADVPFAHFFAKWQAALATP